MKKTLILLIFLLTGCFGEVGKGYITKECTKQEEINDIKIETKITLKSKEGKLTNLIIEENYISDKDLTNIYKSKKSEQNMYQKIGGINIDIDNNKYIYNIEIEKTNDQIKDKFKIEEETYKMLDYYKEQNYVCK